MRVRVDDYMRAIKNHLQEAVYECIKAAGHEFEPKAQRSLMKVIFRDLNISYVESKSLCNLLHFGSCD